MMGKLFGLYGLRHGFTAGLIVTLFDVWVVAVSDVPFSLEFLVWMLCFNVAAWLVFGAGIGLLCARGTQSNKSPKEKRLRGLCFIIAPFAFCYGLLTKVSFSVSIEASDVQAEIVQTFYDKLSLIWVAVFLGLLFVLWKRMKRSDRSTLNFCPEIATICFLYMVCSNMNSLHLLAGYLHQDITTVHVVLVFLALCAYMAWHLWGGILRMSTSFMHVLLCVFIICLLAGVSIRRAGQYSRETAALLNTASLALNSVKTPYVILIVLDTLRADRLTLYADTGIGKNLEKFSQGALVFRNCFAPSSWTLPSHATLFTGLYSTEHGAHDDLDGEPLFGCWYPPNPLAEEFVTMAEVFRDAGYQTAAISANYTALGPESKIFQGFQHADCSAGMGKLYQAGNGSKPIFPLFCWITGIKISYAKHYLSAAEINRTMFSLVSAMHTSPFLLFVNYMDAHDPYLPDLAWESPVSACAEQLRNLRSYFTRLISAAPDAAWYDFLLQQYDKEIVSLDAQLGNFFVFLKQLGIYDDSLIVVVSDHGEMFNEKGCNGHRTPLYQEVLHVPLLIKYPLQERTGIISDVMTFPDILATILAESDLSLPGHHGKPLGGQQTFVAEFYSYAMGHHQALFDNGFKIMVYGDKRGPQYRKVPYGLKTFPELYNLNRDARETVNICETAPAQASVMQALLAQWNEKYLPRYQKESTRPAVKKETIDGFRALGYIQ